jgi:acetylornithine deacetylase/succinyl-diaminopimelate desuccinylase-like protein
VELTATVEAFLRELCDVLGIAYEADDVEGVLAKLGPAARLVGATVRHTANPTMLEAGYKHNVIPQKAVAYVDCRFLPGGEQRFHDELARLVGPDVAIEMIHTDVALETAFDGPLVDAMKAALHAEDPDGRPVPYCLSGGTDAKHFARLGIRCFGFSPLRLPADLDFAGMFHGVDERVPIESLRFGTRVLSRFLAMA